MDECCVHPNTITLFEQFSVERPNIADIHHHIRSVVRFRVRVKDDDDHE